MVGFIISLLIIGVIAGYLGRLLLPGKDPMGFVQTVGVGILGSFVGGTLGALIFGGEFQLNAAGIIGSIIGTIIVLLILRQTRKP